MDAVFKFLTEAPFYTVVFVTGIAMWAAALLLPYKKPYKIYALKEPGRIILAILGSILIILGITLFVFVLLRTNPGPSPTPTVTSPTSLPTSTPLPTLPPAATLTALPTSTPTPTALPTWTPTPAASSTPTGQGFMITNCIQQDIWHFFPWDVLVPVTTVDNRLCENLGQWGFFAQPKDPSLRDINGLRLVWTSATPVSRGIYFYLPDQQTLNLSMDIYQVSSSTDCGVDEICDANILIGFGSPFLDQVTAAPQGWFLNYRVTAQDSPRLTCLLGSAYTRCAPILSEAAHLENGHHDLQFDINGPDVFITIDGERYQGPTMINQPRIFWIGYDIRKSGTVDAFFQFTQK